MKYSELVRLLKHSDFDTVLTVPNHGAKEIGKGLAAALLKQAKLIN